MNIVAEIHSTRDIHVALRDRFDEIGISRLTIDTAAGLTEGHASKLLAPDPIRRFGDVSLWPTLEVAGLKMVLIEDPDALARTSKLRKRDQRKVRTDLVSMRTLNASRAAVLRELTSKAGKARLTKMTAAARRRVAKLAAKARWAKRKKKAS
jgi:hypothetical protein